jgi:L-rhamnose mutarotase
MTTGSLFKQKTTTEEQFEAYHHRHPEVYEEFVRIARMVKAHGFKTYSAYACRERVRWHFQFERDAADDFKISNNLTPHYARLIMEQEPDLAGFFEIKRLKDEA